MCFLKLYNISTNTPSLRKDLVELSSIISARLIALYLLVVSYPLTFVVESFTLYVFMFIVLLFALTSTSRILFALLSSNIFAFLYLLECSFSSPYSS